jgi:hypothetical protein
MAGFVVHNIKLNFVDFGSRWHVISHTSGKILSLSYHTQVFHSPPLLVHFPTTLVDMPADGKVYCAHCSSYIPQRLEREHCKLVTMPYTSAPARIPLRLRFLADSDSDSNSQGGEAGDGSGAHEEPVAGPAAADVPQLEFVPDDENLMDDNNGCHDREVMVPDSEDIPDVPRSGFSAWRVMHNIPSDSEEDSDLEDEVTDEENEEDDHYVDWAAIESNHGLSALDRLGESFDRDVAAISKCYHVQ